MNEENQQLATIAPQNIEKFGDTYNMLIKFVATKLVQKKNVEEGGDYGIIPGTKKKALFKNGAEKIAFFFSLKPNFETVSQTEDFDKGFFFYKIKCILIHFPTGKVAGEAMRSCNSREKKYGYVVVSEKYATEEQKARAISKFQNDKGYTMLKITKSPDEIAEQANTILAMAQKRALVAAVVHATMATEIFDGSGDSEEDDMAPEHPVTQEEDPSRVQALRALFGAASQRGFESEFIEQQLEKHFHVTETKMLSTNQIREFTERMITTYSIVDKGAKPKKILVDDKYTVPLYVASPEGDPEELEIKYYCRNIAAHGDNNYFEVPANSSYKWFCGKECADAYWGDSGRRKSL